MLRKVALLSLAFISTLVADEVKLKDVLVTAKSNQEVANTPASYTIITADDISKISQNSLEGILQTSVGIVPTVNDSAVYGRKSLSIRGMSSNYTLILLNGRRVSGTDAQIGHSNFQYNWVPLDAIERIEVIRGPMSSLYGSKGLGGVVNIITKPVQKGVHGNVNAEGGFTQGSNSGNEYALGANIRAKVFDKLDIFFSAEKRDVGVTTDENNDSVTEVEGKDIVNALLNLEYHIDDTQSVFGSFLYGREDRNAKDYDKYYKITKKQYSLGYKKDFENFGISANGYRTQSDSHAKRFSYTHRLKDDIFNVEANTDIIKNNYIVVGAEYREESYHKDYDAQEDKSKDFEDEISYLAGYAQDEISITDDLLLTLGLRYDKHENFGSHLSPKVYLVYELNDKFRIKGGYGSGFSAPTVTQSSDSYTFVNPYAGHAFYGNSDLKPETSDNFELGFDYTSSNKHFEMIGFYNQIKDLISSTTIGSMPNPIPGFDDISIHQYSNVGKAKMYGAEITWNHQNVVENLDYTLGYTYLKTEDKSTGEELTLRPKHKINAQVTYNFPYKISTSLTLQYIGEQKQDVQVGSTRVYERQTLSGYTLGSLQVSKTFLDSLKLSLGVENLFDKQLNDNYEYELRRRYYYARINYSF